MEDLIYINTEDGLRGGLPAPAEGVLYLADDEVLQLARRAGRTDVVSVDAYRFNLPSELLPDGVRLSE